MEHESYIDLMLSLPHWGFELTTTIVQDLLIGLLLWPWLRRRFNERMQKEHVALDREHGVVHPAIETQYRNVKLVP